MGRYYADYTVMSLVILILSVDLCKLTYTVAMWILNGGVACGLTAASHNMAGVQTKQ